MDATFPVLLRRRRREARLTQFGLAARARIGTRTVCALEQGARRPHRSTATVLADALGLRDRERDEFLASARGATRGRPGGVPR